MSFLLAVTFLTVIPLRRGAQYEHPALGRAMLWFPVVGLLIGGAVCGALLLAAQVLPGMLPEIVAVVFLVGLTGALHLDGLADTFDGIFGGRDRASRLRIMRDTGIGAYGLAAVVCAVLLKVGAFEALGTLGRTSWASQLAAAGRRAWLPEAFGHRWVQVAVVGLMPVWGRWTMTLAAGVGPYARPEGGVGAVFVERMSVVESAVLALIPFGLAGFLLGWAGVLAGAVMVLVSVPVLLWWRGKLGGVTGDVMGALGELAEMAFVLAALILLPAATRGLPY